MNSTKGRVAQKFKEIVCKKSFQKITISDIAKECDMTRENFYYHFHDKFDIIRWIIEVEVLNQLPETKDFLLWIDEMTESFQKDRQFYQRIFNELGKDAIREQIAPVLEKRIRKIIELTSKDTVWSVRKENKDFVISFISGAFVEMVFRSIQEKEIFNPELFQQNLSFLTDHYLPFLRIEKEIEAGKE
ncbi:MAG: TetR/AcrR family transcriptional regulator C-terminal domain-containing protein [Eubacteriales bacterium]|nr:TetR/AcrR family transcriptional regulator C-terminal domain-containing protein [Eubacteriales bacterium]